MVGQIQTSTYWLIMNWCGLICFMLDSFKRPFSFAIGLFFGYCYVHSYNTDVAMMTVATDTILHIGKSLLGPELIQH